MEDFLKMMGWKYLRLDGGTKTEDRAGHVALLDASDSYAGHRADVENMATSPGLHSLSPRHLSRARPPALRVKKSTHRYLYMLHAHAVAVAVAPASRLCSTGTT